MNPLQKLLKIQTHWAQKEPLRSILVLYVSIGYFMAFLYILYAGNKISAQMFWLPQTLIRTGSIGHVSWWTRLVEEFSQSNDGNFAAETTVFLCFLPQRTDSIPAAELQLMRSLWVWMPQCSEWVSAAKLISTLWTKSCDLTASSLLKCVCFYCWHTSAHPFTSDDSLPGGI